MSIEQIYLPQITRIKIYEIIHIELIYKEEAFKIVGVCMEVRKHFGWKLDIVRRSDKVKGFEVLPHRWIVERTFLAGSVAIIVCSLYRQHSPYAEISHKLNLRNTLLDLYIFFLLICC